MANHGHLRYSREHAWVTMQDGIATIGITDYAQNKLGDVVLVELVEIGTRVMRDEEFGTLESVKAATVLLSPINEIVMDTNDTLNDEPSKVNDDPYGEGWMIRMIVEEPGELAALMNATEYLAFLEREKNEA